MSEKELVTLTIDGHSVRAPKGTSIIDAAKASGIEIPYYCYHPGLSVVGSCRMCLVEIEKIPKLQPSCATPVGEGMVVRTRTPETLRNRQSVLEFLLLNHPLDCPVCDQAGECELQNYYMDHGVYDPRFNENKTKRKKAFPIGPHVMLDQERCILCTRCVRFTREISKTGELAVHDRGHLSEIDIFPGAELDNPYSGNVVDICPVGALTDRDFRFQCRVWFLGRTPSICPGCSRGCNIEIHYNERFNPRYHDKRVQRLKPRYNPDVNGFWMCDDGQVFVSLHRCADAPEGSPGKVRDGLARGLVGRGDRGDRPGTDRRSRAEGPGSVAVLASPQMTNEELFCLRQLFASSLGVERIGFRAPSRAPVYSDDFLITADKNPNTRGAEVLGLDGTSAEQVLAACAEGKVRFLYVCHHDLTLGFDADAVAAALGQMAFVAFHGSHEQATAALADAQLPAAVYAETEGTFTNVQGRVQRISAAVPPLGESLPDLEILARLAAELGVAPTRATAQDVFREIGRKIEAFAGMTYESVGDAGRMLG